MRILLFAFLIIATLFQSSRLSGQATESSIVVSGDLDPESLKIFERARMEYGQRNYMDAYADLRKVADRAPQAKGLWTLIAVVEQHLGRVDQSMRDFQKALRVDPNDAQAHAEFGATLLSMGKPDLAAAEFHQAEQIDPGNHRAHYLMGWYLFQVKKDYVQAVPEFEKALAIKDGSFNDGPQIQHFLSEAYFHAKQQDKGVEMLKLSVKDSPDAFTLNNAAYSLADNDVELDLAHEYVDSALKDTYERLSKLQPDSIRREDLAAVHLTGLTWDTLGWIYYRKGDLPMAEKYLQAAWNLGQSRETSLHLAEVYEKHGRMLEAKKYYAISARPMFMQTTGPVDPGRARLTKLLGRQAAEQLIQKESSTAIFERTLHLGKIAPPGSKGEFFFIFAPGPKLVAINPIGADGYMLDSLLKQQAKIAAPVLFPEAAPEKLIRQGLIFCATSGACDLVFYTSDVPAEVGRLGAGAFR
jgi:tetratricopeptide (TPR) repeat protein